MGQWFSLRASKQHYAQVVAGSVLSAALLIGPCLATAQDRVIVPEYAAALQALHEFNWAPAFYVVHSAQAFDALWDKRGFSYVDPPPAKPRLDFSEVSLIGIVLGDAPNGCYRLRTHEVYVSSTGATVVYQVQSPEPQRSGLPSVLCTASEVRLTQFFTVPRVDGHVTFRYVARN